MILIATSNVYFRAWICRSACTMYSFVGLLVLCIHLQVDFFTVQQTEFYTLVLKINVTACVSTRIRNSMLNKQVN